MVESKQRHANGKGKRRANDTKDKPQHSPRLSRCYTTWYYQVSPRTRTIKSASDLQVTEFPLKIVHGLWVKK
eukprot:59877-Amphidinium_carterae.1